MKLENCYRLILKVRDRFKFQSSFTCWWAFIEPIFLFGCFCNVWTWCCAARDHLQTPLINWDSFRNPSFPHKNGHVTCVSQSSHVCIPSRLGVSINIRCTRLLAFNRSADASRWTSWTLDSLCCCWVQRQLSIGANRTPSAGRSVAIFAATTCSSEIATRKIAFPFARQQGNFLI